MVPGLLQFHRMDAGDSYQLQSGRVIHAAVSGAWYFRRPWPGQIAVPGQATCLYPDPHAHGRSGHHRLHLHVQSICNIWAGGDDARHDTGPYPSCGALCGGERLRGPGRF